ncbi:MAG TPA: hypothetical protein PKU79_07935 [Mesotoga sp.]|nr:hypothetical protein [Mesotoga sp.]
MKTVLIVSLVAALTVISVITLIYTVGLRNEILSSTNNIGTKNLEIELKALSAEIGKVKDAVESLNIVDYSLRYSLSRRILQASKRSSTNSILPILKNTRR